MMWHCEKGVFIVIYLQVVWWCDTVYDDVTLCMMMWHCVWWCDTVYDDVTLCMMMWHCEKGVFIVIYLQVVCPHVYIYIYFPVVYPCILPTSKPNHYKERLWERGIYSHILASSMYPSSISIYTPYIYHCKYITTKRGFWERGAPRFGAWLVHD
jgi:hypothetical protein